MSHHCEWVLMRHAGGGDPGRHERRKIVAWANSFIERCDKVSSEAGSFNDRVQQGSSGLIGSTRKLSQ